VAAVAGPKVDFMQLVYDIEFKFPPSKLLEWPNEDFSDNPRDIQQNCSRKGATKPYANRYLSLR